jgi:hypothetical protein
LGEVLSGGVKFASGTAITERRGLKTIGARKLAVENAKPFDRLSEGGSLGGVLGDGYQWWIERGFESFTTSGKITQVSPREHVVVAGVCA